MLKHTMSIKRSGQFLLWSAVALLSLNVGRLIYNSSVHVQAASYVPYTVIRTEKGFDQSGSLKYTNHYIEALRSDGSTMWKGSTKDVQQRKIFFANGDEIQTNELPARKSTYPKAHVGIPFQRNSASSCFNVDELKAGWAPGGEDMVGGHRAFRLVNKSSNRTMTVWYGLDAGCALLQQRFEHETGVTEQSLAALILGEPDTSHFQVSDTFAEVPPSVLLSCSGAGSVCKSEMPESIKQKLDKRYADARAKNP